MLINYYKINKIAWLSFNNTSLQYTIYVDYTQVLEKSDKHKSLARLTVK